MGVTKTEAFEPDLVRLADLTKVLGHPARLAILSFLRQKNTCVCGDIVDALPLSQSTVSQHLKELRRVGLIKGEIDPPRVCYCIDEENWAEAASLLQSFFAQEKKEENCC